MLLTLRVLRLRPVITLKNSRAFSDRSSPTMEETSLEPSAKRSKLEEDTPTDGGKPPAVESQSSYRFPPRCSLREPDVGITEYIRSAPKFFGLLKERYSDFMVHEIRKDGSVVRLTDTTTVPQMTGFSSSSDTSSSDGFQFSAEDSESLHGLLNFKSNRKYVDITVPDESKETRKAIHHAIRARFPGLQSAMVKDNSQLIRVKFSRSGDTKRVNFPANERYCKFVLYKENEDTPNAIMMLSRILARNRGAFSTCGLKDRRGITTQEVTLSHGLASKLAGLRMDRNMRIGNYSYTDKPLMAGGHAGNRFTIVLRHFDGTEEALAESVKSLAEHGFINYFGMQRFGNGAVGTHIYGKELLAGRFKEAIDVILGSFATEPNSSKYDAYQVWKETGDAQRAKNCFRRPCQEFDIYNGLAKAGIDKPRVVLGHLQSTVLTFFFHAYQSWIWNRVASYRIKEFGLQPIIGDIVLPPDVPDEEGDEEEGCGETDAAAAVGDGDSASASADAEDDKKHKGVPIEFVTAENISQFNIHDVVLPMPGKYSKYPKNKMYDVYREALDADGIDINSFPGFMQLGRNSIKLGGFYRHIVTKPMDVAGKVLPYNTNVAQLVVTDVERMAGKTEVDEIPADGAAYKAARLEFSLRSSCYATMAVREVCQVDTSQGHQRNVSQGMAGQDEKSAVDGSKTDAATEGTDASAGVAPQGAGNEG